MNKVYVLNRYGNQIESASKFGEIVELTTGSINPFAIDRLAWNIAPELSKFQPEDYFLLTGPGSGYIIAGMLLFARYDSINCLRYDSQTREYVASRVSKKPIPPYIDGTSNPGRIFVLNYSGHSILSALGYSTLPEDEKLVTLTKGNISQADVDKLYEQVLLGSGHSVGLADYQEGDMLLLSGPGLLHMIAVSILSTLGKDISLLLFNPKQHGYIKRDIHIAHIEHMAKMAVEAAA